MKSEMTTEELKSQTIQYAVNLMAHIRVAFAYLDTYKALLNNHKTYRTAMLQTPLFFSVTEKALVSSLMVELCKLFEDNPNVLSVKKLYNICEQNIKSFPKYRERDGVQTGVPSSMSTVLAITKTEFEKNKAIISNLKTQRDTIWAHHDKRWILKTDELETDYPIEWEDIESLLCFASDFVNSVILNFTSGVESPFFNAQTACLDQVQSMLILMENGAKTDNQFH